MSVEASTDDFANRPRLIEQEIERAFSESEHIPLPCQPIVNAAIALCLRGGKRIRPTLCILGYEGIASDAAPLGVYTFAAGVEILHAFMLIHDDLIDRSSQRRSGPTVHHSLIGKVPAGQEENLAMLAGDMLFAISVETMAKANLSPRRVISAQQAVLQSARSAALGECLDVLYSHEAIDRLNTSDLVEVLRLKTARYTFEAPLVAGALLASAPKNTVQALSSFGSRAGIAFQLADDLLDLYGQEQVIGKPIGGDIREKKRTLLIRLALERATDSDRAHLIDVLHTPSVTDEQVQWVTELIRQLGVAQSVKERVATLISNAVSVLDQADLRKFVKSQLLTITSSIRDSIESCNVGT